MYGWDIMEKYGFIIWKDLPFRFFFDNSPFTLKIQHWDLLSWNYGWGLWRIITQVSKQQMHTKRKGHENFGKWIFSYKVLHDKKLRVQVYIQIHQKWLIFSKCLVLVTGIKKFTTVIMFLKNTKVQLKNAIIRSSKRKVSEKSVTKNMASEQWIFHDCDWVWEKKI